MGWQKATVSSRVTGSLPSAADYNAAFLAEVDRGLSKMVPGLAAEISGRFLAAGVKVPKGTTLFQGQRVAPGHWRISPTRGAPIQELRRIEFGDEKTTARGLWRSFRASAKTKKIRFQKATFLKHLSKRRRR